MRVKEPPAQATGSGVVPAVRRVGERCSLLTGLCLVVVFCLGCILSACALDGTGARSERPAPWQTAVLDRAGWVGLEDDVDWLLREAPDVYWAFLIEGGRLWLHRENDEVLRLAYHPSPAGLERAESMGLRVAEIETGPPPTVRERTGVSSALHSDDAPLLVPWEGACFGRVEGRTVLFYYDPAANQLVQHDVLTGTSTRHEAPEELLLASSVQMAHSPLHGVVHLAVRTPEKALYAVLDTFTGLWSLVSFPRARRFLVHLHGDAICLIHADRAAVTLYHAPERSLTSELARRGPDAGTNPFEAQPLGAPGSPVDDFALASSAQALYLVWLAATSPYTFEARILRLNDRAEDIGGFESACPTVRPIGGEDDLAGMHFFAPSAAVDTSGGLHVVFWDPIAGEIRHAREHEGAWRLETIEQVGLGGTTAAIALDGLLIVAYFVPESLEVRLAWREL